MMVSPRPYSCVRARRGRRRGRSRCAGRRRRRARAGRRRRSRRSCRRRRRAAPGSCDDLDVDVLRAAARAHVEAERLGAAVLGAEEALDDRDVGLQRVAPAGEAVRAVGGVGVDDLELRLRRRAWRRWRCRRWSVSSPHHVVGRPSASPSAWAWAVVTTSARLTSCSCPRVSRCVSVRRPSCDGAAKVGSASVASAKAAAPMAGRRIILPGSIGPERRRFKPPCAGRGAGSMPQRPASADSSGVIAQRSGSGSPSKSGAAPLSAIEPVLSPIARISATSSALSTLDRADGGQLGALVLDRLRAAGLLDQRRRDAGDRAVREVPVAGELQHRQPVALGDRAHRLELGAARPRPSPRAGSRGGRSAGTRAPAARRRGTARRSRRRG